MPIRPDSILFLEHGVEPSQRGSILVVDDEPDIRILICRVLRERGFSVLEAGDGEEALALIACEPLQLIISNIRMPRMSGLSLYRHLGEICPTLTRRMVFCSGDIAGEDSRRFLDRTEAPWLEKPFDLGELMTLVIRHVGAPIELDGQVVRDIRALLARRISARHESLSLAWAEKA